MLTDVTPATALRAFSMNGLTNGADRGWSNPAGQRRRSGDRQPQRLVRAAVPLTASEHSVGAALLGDLRPDGFRSANSLRSHTTKHSRTADALDFAQAAVPLICSHHDKRDLDATVTRFFAPHKARVLTRPTGV
jgi:hypothetical protein